MNDAQKQNARIGYVQLTLHFAQEEDGSWTGECVELGTATFGDSLVQVRIELGELIGEHLHLLEEHNERERFFKQFNIEIVPFPDVQTTLLLNIGRRQSLTQQSTTDFIVPDIYPLQYAA